MNYVYSTLTCDNSYTLYEKTAGGLSVPKAEVLIKGGTGLANKHFITPLGVATSVSDQELALLKENSVFKEQMANGFLIVQEGGKAEDAEKVAADMVIGDGSAPLTEQDAASQGVAESKSKGKK